MVLAEQNNGGLQDRLYFPAQCLIIIAYLIVFNCTISRFLFAIFWAGTRVSAGVRKNEGRTEDNNRLIRLFTRSTRV